MGQISDGIRHNQLTDRAQAPVLLDYGPYING
jgi:hypothetical protein